MARLKCPRGEKPVTLCVPEETPTRLAGSGGLGAAEQRLHPYDVWARTGGGTKPVEKQWKKLGQLMMPFPYWGDGGQPGYDITSFFLRKALEPFRQAHGQDARVEWLNFAPSRQNGFSYGSAVFHRGPRTHRRELRITPPFHIAYDLRNEPDAREIGAVDDRYPDRAAPHILTLPGLMEERGAVTQGYPWAKSPPQIPVDDFGNRPALRVALDQALERGLAGLSAPSREKCPVGMKPVSACPSDLSPGATPDGQMFPYPMQSRYGLGAEVSETGQWLSFGNGVALDGLGAVLQHQDSFITFKKVRVIPVGSMRGWNIRAVSKKLSFSFRKEHKAGESNRVGVFYIENRGYYVSTRLIQNLMLLAQGKAVELVNSGFQHQLRPEDCAPFSVWLDQQVERGLGQ
jgi:hypothetical protein